MPRLTPTPLGVRPRAPIRSLADARAAILALPAGATLTLDETPYRWDGSVLRAGHAVCATLAAAQHLFHARSVWNAAYRTPEPA